MTNKLLSLLLTIGALASVNAKAEQKKPTAMDRIAKSLVIIYGDKGQGSGVVVASDAGGSWILTNKHVCNMARIDEPDKNLLRFLKWNEVATKLPLNVKDISQQRVSKGQVYKVAENSDLCLIFTLEPNLPTAPLAKRYPIITEGIVNYGNPLGVEGVLGISFFVGYNLTEGMYTQLSHLPINHGSSGSGIFNSEGELVGIVNAMDDKTTPITAFSVPLQIIRPFIHELGK